MTDLQKFAETESLVRDREKLAAELDRTKRELANSRAALRAQESELEQLRSLGDLKVTLQQTPDWLITPKRKTPGETHSAIICTQLSDTHFDEVVNPLEIHGLNAFNREIGVQRLERWVNGIEFLANNYMNSNYLHYDGIVVSLTGDTFTGEIHPELKETNEGLTPETIRFWFPKMRGAMLRLAELFGRVHVISVPGNHGRLTMKKHAKKKAAGNIDWLVAGLIADSLAEDDRFTFDVGEADDALVRVYDTLFLHTHGDETNGGGGIGGIWPPIKRLQARKYARYAELGLNFDWLVMGHWHQYVHSQGLIVNGSLKGYDEWTASMNFNPERAQQSFWLVTPENGVTGAFPIICADPKAEGWEKYRKNPTAKKVGPIARVGA